eukprot:802301-Rhodomonas_salina.1
MPWLAQASVQRPLNRPGISIWERSLIRYRRPVGAAAALTDQTALRCAVIYFSFYSQGVHLRYVLPVAVDT